MTDIPTQEEVIFSRLKTNIDRYLKDNYPFFDNNLPEEMAKLKHEQDKIKSSTSEFYRRIEDLPKKIQSEVIIQINDFLSKDYPDLDKSLKMTAKNAENKLKKLEDSIKTLELLNKDRKIYESLCEDVYKMRDEFKEISKFMDQFKKKIKKAFEI